VPAIPTPLPNIFSNPLCSLIRSFVRIIVVILLFLASPSFAADSFTFQDNGKSIEGYYSLPQGSAKVLVLYFHRGIEDRNAVIEWGKLLNPAGYAVAGYTATPTKDVLLQARSALNELRKRKELANIPCVVMGASMGTPVAAKLFASDLKIRGMILVVPGESEICSAFQKSAGRPVLMISAEKDEIADSTVTKKLMACLPKENAQFQLLKNQSHRFPPSFISSRILEWLKTTIKI
jgi:hypothetical protein